MQCVVAYVLVAEISSETSVFFILCTYDINFLMLDTYHPDTINVRTWGSVVVFRRQKSSGNVDRCDSEEIRISQRHCISHNKG